ncbi:predicted protein [Histoplasma capsulatum var. duboisii H88]|uniref:Predicted protein n=1 Tax=Ajellomyces capsulatus (strain H88) TaxID=544711 RepID=F0ULE0_AJEC8|nr:predicted protein [Histoplasma capsulatum var. duboisii H88]
MEKEKQDQEETSECGHTDVARNTNKGLFLQGWTGVKDEIAHDDDARCCIKGYPCCQKLIENPKALEYGLIDKIEFLLYTHSYGTYNTFSYPYTTNDVSIKESKVASLRSYDWLSTRLQMCTKDETRSAKESPTMNKSGPSWSCAGLISSWLHDGGPKFNLDHPENSPGSRFFGVIFVEHGLKRCLTAQRSSCLGVYKYLFVRSKEGQKGFVRDLNILETRSQQ